MKATHRHSTGHEHEFEPVHGLPEALPAGEQILWQGAPNWRALAVQALHVRKLAVYFAALLALRAALVLNDGGTAADALRSLPAPAALAAVALGLLCTLAWLMARTTAYTITNRRVVMRMGIVLTLAFNLPYKRLAAADLSLGAQGIGNIALRLSGSDRIAWLNLWPHARPWQLAQPQPMMRCVSGAREAAQLLTQAWQQATGLAAQAAAVTAERPTAPAVLSPSPQTALQAH